jgi:hypothetical protein
MGPRFSPEKVVVGVSLVALGLVGALARSRSVDFLTVVHTWWPASLIVWGVAELYNTFADRAGRRLQ